MMFIQRSFVYNASINDGGERRNRDIMSILMEDLKTFNCVYECKSMSLAADVLFSTQPSVSRSIKHLEEECHNLLFQRKHHTLVPTPFGEGLYKCTRESVKKYEETINYIRSWQEDTCINIGFTISVGTRFVPQLIRKLNRQHKNIKVISTCLSSDELFQSLDIGVLNIVIAESRESLGDHISTLPLGSSIYIPMLPPDSDFKDSQQRMRQIFAEKPLLMLDDIPFSDQIIRKMQEKIGDKLDVVYYSNISTLLSNVHYGQGISFLPQMVILDFLSTKYITTCQISDFELKQEYSLYWNNNKLITPHMSEIMDLCKNNGNVL